MSGIYIHIPFCRRRCNYCDFYFVTNTRLIQNFLSALIKEIESYSSHCNDFTFDTIYFGGGTPSILSDRQFELIIGSLYEYYSISDNPEISIEANPEDFFGKELSSYKSAGINRISFGVQSFIDRELKFLTRQHTSEQAEEAVKNGKKHFENVNVDIIYSLPDQKKSDIEFSLSKAVHLGANHVSAYTLTYEEKTVLFRDLKADKFIKKTTDEEAELFRFVSDILKNENFNHYEVSNFAKQGFECRHNLKYWRRENYLGLGPSAHSLICNKRRSNVKSVLKYNELLLGDKLPVDSEFEPDINQTKLEFIMLALRSGGISYAKYGELFGSRFENEFSISIKELTKNNFAINESGKFRLNENGYAVADEIIARFF